MSKYAQSALKISDRGGDQSHGGGDSKFWGWGGRVSMVGDNPLMGGESPPHTRQPRFPLDRVWQKFTAPFILLKQL